MTNVPGINSGEHRPDKEEEQTTEPLPKFYAVLPLLPLILILAFSPLFHTGISLSVMGAVVISVILVAVIEMLRKKQLRSCFNDILSWFTGMGTAFSNLLTLIICVQFFASMLGRLNGFTFLINTALNAGFNGYILLILFGLLMYMACLMLGDGGVMGITLAPQLLGIAASLGISPYAAILAYAACVWRTLYQLRDKSPYAVCHKGKPVQVQPDISPLRSTGVFNVCTDLYLFTDHSLIPDN